jgi:hypothetical protein
MVSDVSGATHRVHPLGLHELVSCDYCEILTQHQTLCGHHYRLQEIRDFHCSPKTHWTLKCLLLSLQTSYELLPHIWPWCLTPSTFTTVATPLIDTILSSGRCQWRRVLSCGSAVVCVLRYLVQIPPGACLSLFVSFVSCQVEVSAASWSLVQRGLNNCGALLCLN